MSRWLGIIILLCTPSYSSAAIIINEIAWMGSADSANDEWIELHNTGATTDVTDWVLSDGGNLSIVLTGSITDGDFAVLERTDDDSAPGAAFLIYTGALSNAGATVTLRDQDGIIQDQVAGGENWENVGGDNVTKDTGQLTTAGWITAVPTPGAANATTPSETTDETEPEPESSVATKSNTSTGVRATSKNKVMRTFTLPENTLKLTLTAPERAYVHQPVQFELAPSGISSGLAKSLRYTWNYGDTYTGTQKSPTHTYVYPGTYVVLVTAEFASQSATFRHEITVLPVQFSITKTRLGDWQIHNNAKYEIDVSGFVLHGDQSVTLPPQTILLPNSTITIKANRITTRRNPVVVLSDPSEQIVASYSSEVTTVEELVSTVVEDSSSVAAPVPLPPVAPAFSFKPAAPVTEDTAGATSAPALVEVSEPVSSPSPTNPLWPYWVLAGVLACSFVGVFATKIGSR